MSIENKSIPEDLLPNSPRKRIYNINQRNSKNLDKHDKKTVTYVTYFFHLKM